MIIMIYDYIINRNTSNLIIIIIISMTTLMLTSTLEIVFYPDIAYTILLKLQISLNNNNKIHIKQTYHNHQLLQRIIKKRVLTI